jgi:hypothetical protein
MRLFGRFAGSCWLAAGLALGCSWLGSAALLAAGPAVAATASQSGQAGQSGDSGQSGLSGQTVASVVPSSATPGSRVTFAVSCSSMNATSATFFGQTLGLPEQIPMEAGAADGDFVVTVTLPASIRPGVYRPDIDCSDGTSATARLTVTGFPAAGGAQTGDGTTSTQTNNGLVAAGLGLTAVGAICGGIALRRRSMRS